MKLQQKNCKATDKGFEHCRKFPGLFKQNIINAAKTLVNDLASDVKDFQESRTKRMKKENA